MKGGCYCGALRYDVTEKPVVKGQCHCRACQHYTGGSVNYFMAVPSEAFVVTSGDPRLFKRSDRDKPVSRYFCPICGVQVYNTRPGLDMTIFRVGTLDEPELFGGPRIAIYLREKQAYHHVPEGVACFEESIAPK